MFATPLVFVVPAMVRTPPANPHVSPNVSIEKSLDVPPGVQAFLRKSCYDCHSAETRWPWYSRLPVLSSLIHADVTKGRKALNFSEWSTSAGAHPNRAAATLTAACAAVQYGIMPKAPYPMMHRDARPSREDVAMFCGWAQQESAALRKRNSQRVDTAQAVTR